TPTTEIYTLSLHDALPISEPEITESPKGAMAPTSLGRYLDYCTDLLSLTGKLAALLVQRFKDDVVMSEVNEIEALTSALAGRIWHKIRLLEPTLQAEQD